MYSVKQIAEILTDAAERCNWQYIGINREPNEARALFAGVFLPADKKDDLGFDYHSFSATSWCYYFCDGKVLHELTEEEWFKAVDEHFWKICGVHLDMNSAENKTATCGD